MPKKILLVTRPIAPPWDEASKNFAYNLALNLPGFNFYFLTNGGTLNLPPHIKHRPIYTSNTLNWMQKARLLKLLTDRKNFDIIHFMLTPTKINVFAFRKFIKSEGVKTVQTIATLREDLFSDKEIKKLVFADIVVTYSKYAKDKLIKLGFKNAEPRTELGSGTGVEQIYPGIDLELYKPAERDGEFMKNLNLSKNDFVVTYPGEFIRLGATDDILNMIYQYTSILVENNIKIIFACRVKNKEDAEKKEEVREKLKEKGLLDIARFPETFTTLEKMLNASDLVIFPVRDMKGKFDVPLAVIEAMACGKPVIISDLPILKEFANDENSVIIKSGDAEELKNAILGLCQNKEKREIIGKNARIFTEENFDIKKIAEQYKKIYEKL